MTDKEIICEGTDEIVCPYCGYEFRDSWEIFLDGECIATLDCPECEKEFSVKPNWDVTYYSSKIEEKKNG